MADIVDFVLDGGLAVDDRGSLSFCNEFDMESVRRFYVVSNHESGFVRAWHGHQRENKFLFVVSGAIMVKMVKVDDWAKPSKELKTLSKVLDARNPCIMSIPGGYAHGFMTLMEGTSVMFFSTSLLGESLNDDYRYPYDYWGSWDIVQR